jgi:hypothetical protein
MEHRVEMSAFRNLVPLIPAGASLAEALSFYVDRMGFAVSWRNETMAGVYRDNVAFNLVENSSKEWAENASFSIGVSDLSALYEEYRARTATIGPLESKPWGRREFHMIVPPGVCFQFHESSSE